MDHQAFVDMLASSCAVLSVEREPGGGWGEIRIVRANAAYKAAMGPAYYDGMLYQELVPEDTKFEYFCYCAAILGQPMKAYVEVKALHGWIDQQIVPMKSDDPNLGYCQFLFEFTKVGEADRMISVSPVVSAAVLRAVLTLMGGGDFHTRLKEVLLDILERSGALAGRIMLIDHEKRETVNFCEVTQLEMPHTIDPETGAYRTGLLEYELVRSWEDMIGVSNDIIIRNQREMGELELVNPAWVKTLRDYQVESLVLIPLRQGKQIFGYLYVVNFDVEKVVEVKELVELMAFVLGTEVSNYLLMERLEEMSNSDELTGIQNRNAMVRRMNQLKKAEKGQPFGVINLDLNGLKTVNDLEGHDAGDRLLLEAGEVLKKVFYRQDLYRTGGDEFIVIMSDIEEEVFFRKVEKLRRVTEKNGSVSFAIGAFWSDGSVNLREAFLHADERMYADKNAYYLSHPEKKRR